MFDELVSIVIPIYNTAEDLLRRSVDSAVNSTYSNVEVLLVDDGSDESTIAVLKKIESSDKRINMYIREHEGVAAARNFGVQHSDGHWIMFLDSDDCIEQDAIEKMLACAYELSTEYSEPEEFSKYPGYPDIITADWTRRGTVKYSEPIKEGLYDMRDSETRRGVIDKVFQLGDKPHINDSYWGKLFRKEFVRNITPIIDTRIIQGEDLCFILLAVISAQLIVSTGVTAYNYSPRKDSVSSAKNTHYLANLDIMYNSVKKQITENVELPEEREYLLGQWRQTIIHVAEDRTHILLG